MHESVVRTEEAKRAAMGQLASVLGIVMALVVGLALVAERYGRLIQPLFAEAATPLTPKENPIADWDEEAYLAAYPEVRAAIAERRVESGLQHYVLHGAKAGYHKRPIRGGRDAIALIYPGRSLQVAHAVPLQQLASEHRVSPSDIRLVNPGLDGDPIPGTMVFLPTRQ